MTVGSHWSSMQRSIRWGGGLSGRRLGRLPSALDLHCFIAFRSFASVHKSWAQSPFFQRKDCLRKVCEVLCSLPEIAVQWEWERVLFEQIYHCRTHKKAEITKQGMSTMMACHHYPPFLESQLLHVRLRSHLGVQPAPWWCSRTKE